MALCGPPPRAERQGIRDGDRRESDFNGAGRQEVKGWWRERSAPTYHSSRHHPSTPPPLCDIPSGCCSFTGPWTVTRSSLRMLLRVATFCRPLRPVLLLVSFPRSRSPVVGVLGPLPHHHLITPPPPPSKQKNQLVRPLQKIASSGAPRDRVRGARGMGQHGRCKAPHADSPVSEAPYATR